MIARRTALTAGALALTSITLAGGAGGQTPTATFTLLAPKPGSITTKARVRVVVRVTAAVPVRQVSLDNEPMHRGIHHTWWKTLQLRNDFAGRNRLHFSADLGGDRGPSATFFYYYYTSIGLTTEFDQGSALGCNPCSFKDRKRDAHGGPDISRVRAIAKSGKVRITIKTRNSYSARGGTTCGLFAAPGHNPTSGRVNCFGKGITTPNSKATRPASLAHPNSRTTVVGFSLRALRGPGFGIVHPKYLLIAGWSHGEADHQLDRFPAGYDDFRETDRYIKLQIDTRGLPK